MFKKVILGTLNRLGYTLAHNDWFDREKAHAAALIAEANERAAAEKAHAAALIAEANERAAAEKTHAAALIAEANERIAAERSHAAAVIAAARDRTDRLRQSLEDRSVSLGIRNMEIVG